MNWKLVALMILAPVLAFVPLQSNNKGIRIGSKIFTESVILAELAARMTEAAGAQVIPQYELGGTRLVFESLAVGEIDIYPEYTGTLQKEILIDENVDDEASMREALAKRGISMTDPLGFENSYAIGMKEEVADRLGIEKLSDLARFPDLKMRFSNEFMDRPDGWGGLRKHYGLPQTDVRGMEHELTYRQLDSESIDAIVVYTTDAKIRYYNLRVLPDDLEYFPKYHAVYLYRSDLEQRAPDVAKLIRQLQGKVGQSQMLDMNVRADLKKESEAIIAADFAEQNFDIHVTVTVDTTAQQIWKRTKEHLDLVRKSLMAAILAAIPIGILAAYNKPFGHVALATVGIFQTIPALALLVMLIGPVSLLGWRTVGTESLTAVIALFLYSLLPIVRNTYTGLNGIPVSIQESAAAIGLSKLSRLWLIELPLASPTILAGIKTAAVMNVGFATLGAFVGAGGYGQDILTGIRRIDYPLILQGAIPAAILAMAMQGLFDLFERYFVPQGLKLKPQS